MSDSSSKAAKAALKEARDFIAQKDYKKALKSCKKALNVDKQNYMAFVFCGLCLNELDQPDQALQAYQKAVDIAPDQITGWQGLASFYEKKISIKEEYKLPLTEAYMKIMDLLSEDVVKYVEISSKLVALYVQMKEIDKATDILLSRVQKLDGNEIKVREARSELISLLSQQPELSEDQNQILTQALEMVMTEAQSIQNMEHYKVYIKHQYKVRNLKALVSKAIKMHELYPESVYPLEWFCKIYLEWVTGTLDFDSDLFDDAERFISRLRELSPSSTLGNLAEGCHLWKMGNISEAKEALEETLNAGTSTNFYGMYALCLCLFDMKDFSGAEEKLQATILLLEDKVKEEATRNSLRITLNVLLVKALYYQASEKKLEKAKEIIDNGVEAANATDEYVMIMAKIHASSGNADGVKKLLPILMEKTVPEYEINLIKGLLLKSKGNAEKAIEQLKACVEAKEDNFEAMVVLGQLLWKDDDSMEQSLSYFLKAAKVNPSNPVPFLYLGHYYRRQSDLDKARKCYQRSFQLNSSSEEAGTALSDVYRAQGKAAENLAFLQSVADSSTASSGTGKWAYLRLGIYHLEHDDPSKAILSLQSALRSDPNNINAWECLADGYTARGSYTAALKAYDRVLQLDSENLYAELQIANIKHLLGKYHDAIMAYRRILTQDENNVPTLKGIGESLISQAYEYLEENVNMNAVDNCRDAVEYLTAAASIRPDLSCTWKLLGEACTLTHVLPKETVGFEVPLKLITGEGEGKAMQTKSELIRIGSRCYVRALQLSKDNAECWHDLALNYNVQAEMATAKLERTQFRQKALSAVKKALMLYPKSHQHWNLLGVVAASSELQNHALAQHAFIKSIEVENNAIAWTNLGIIYLLLGHQELSNRAFREAQNQEPSYTRGWVGQALLAEFNGFETEAMDLFRHTTFLGNEEESSVGYSYWVCKTLDEITRGEKSTKDHNRYCIDKMYGVSVAVDCLTRYNERVKQDPCALNMFGILLERENLLKSSYKALKSALESVDPELDVADKIRQNLARVSFKLGQYEEAIALYKTMSKHNFASQCGMALTFYKAAQFQESYNAYQACLEMADDPTSKSHVLAAMATIAYRFQGPQAAKTLLFQSCQLQPPSVNGLFALCVLGIKQSDMMLIDAALAEMERFEGEPEFMVDIVVLRSLVLVLKNQPKEARNVITRAVHKHPDNFGLWRALTFHLLSHEPENFAAASCAERSSHLGKSVKSRNVPEMASLVALCLLRAGKAREGLRAAQKAVHMYPHLAQTWSAFIAAYKKGDEFLGDLLKKFDCLEVSEGNEKLTSWIQNYSKLLK